MKIIRTPSENQLTKLQDILSNDKDTGIVDIYGPQVTNYICMEDEGGSLVGIASINVFEESAELYKLYVAPDFRRKAVGGKLFNETIRFLKEKKLNELLIEVEGESGLFWRSIVLNYKVEVYDDNKFGIIISS